MSGGREAEPLSLWAQRCRVDDVCPPHDHDFVEIALILGGSGRHCSPLGEHALHTGDVIVLRPGTWHSYLDCQQLDVYNCSFAVDVLRGELAPFISHPAINYLFWAGPLASRRRGLIELNIAAESQCECVRHLDALSYHFTSHADNSGALTLERLGHLLMFLGQLARAVPGQDEQQEIDVTAPAQSTLAQVIPRVHPAVRKSMSLLEQDPAYAWSLGELASQMHLDPCHLVRIFKSGTGLSPMAYLARCRAERAATLLLRTDESIPHIARQVGWSDPNYFARRFKAHFGLSAGQYRAQFTARK
ncbi:MAG: hypothetical protein JWN98_1591 [Abditibacteriota bacterium]|nr:hypothetical protein [Abditibacteriota bacterium]